MILIAGVAPLMAELNEIDDFEGIGKAIDQASDLTARYLIDRSSLSATAGHVLNRLHREGPSRITVLAAKEGVTQPTMTQQVQRMERQQLVTRLADPGDGRVALVAITETGVDYLNAQKDIRRKRLSALLSTLTDEQARALKLATDVALPILEQLTSMADADASSVCRPCVIDPSA